MNDWMFGVLILVGVLIVICVVAWALTIVAGLTFVEGVAWCVIGATALWVLMLLAGM